MSAANLDGGIMSASGSTPANVTITVDPNLTDADGALFVATLSINIAANVVGIVALGLHAHWTARRDQSGNTFRYQALYVQGRAIRAYYDIFFVTR